MRQKYTLSTLLALLAIASLATTINAETNIRVRQQIQADSRQEVRTKLETIKIEKRASDSANRAENLGNVMVFHANNLQARFTYHYGRLNTILDKIEAFIDKKVAAGENLDSAKAKLAEAKAKLEQAKVLGEQAVTAFKAIDDDAKLSESKDQIKAARGLAVQARQTFIEALQLMQQTVKLIRTSLNTK